MWEDFITYLCSFAGGSVKPSLAQKHCKQVHLLLTLAQSRINMCMSQLISALDGKLKSKKNGHQTHVKHT